MFSRSDRALVVTVDDAAPGAWASRTAVLHVLETLLENASTHGAGTVHVRARPSRGALTIEVEDEGDGIAGDPELVFRRRHRSSGGDDDTNGERGSGIGLALARRLAEAEGGRLVLSVANRIRVFSLFLPADADPTELVAFEEP